jgi:hypothetical protein
VIQRDAESILIRAVHHSILKKLRERPARLRQRAARFVATMSSINAWTAGERHSPVVTSRARSRRTGSPIVLISRTLTAAHGIAAA